MSRSQMRIVNVNNFESDVSGLNHGEVFILVSDNIELIDDCDIKMVNNIFEQDPTIGFVSADILATSNGMEVLSSVEFTNSIPNTPVFMRYAKDIKFNIDPENKLASILHTYISNSLNFEHISDPYFKVYV